MLISKKLKRGKKKKEGWAAALYCPSSSFWSLVWSPEGLNHANTPSVWSALIGMKDLAPWGAELGSCVDLDRGRTGKPVWLKHWLWACFTPWALSPSGHHPQPNPYLPQFCLSFSLRVMAKPIYPGLTIWTDFLLFFFCFCLFCFVLFLLAAFLSAHVSFLSLPSSSCPSL